MFVRAMTLRDFRGIAGPLTVDLLPPDGLGTRPESPQPVVIYGANGSGKSSICDALEFGLRDVISRRSVGGEKVKREIRHLFGAEPPSVDLTLSDGTVIHRGATKGDSIKGPRGAVAGFEVSPLVIRRSAVEGFWQVSAVQRLDFFWDYLKPPGAELQTPEDEVFLQAHVEAQRKLAEIESELRTLVPEKYDGYAFAFPRRLAAATAVRQGILRAKRERGQRMILSIAEEQLVERHAAALRDEELLRDPAAKAALKLPRTYDEIAALLTTAAPRVAEGFRALSGQSWVADVEIAVSGDSSLEIALHRHIGQPLEPSSILSEAYLDLLALLVLVEVHIACTTRGQERVLILDDVFQSVDSSLRQRILRYMCSRLQGWQVVLTVHDRLWLDLSVQIFKEQSGSKPAVVELRHGSADRTPTIVKGGTGPLRDIDFVQLNGGSAVLLAGATGRALEALLDRLSVSLRCKMVRQDPEKYMINDLLGAVRPVLQNCANDNVRNRFQNIGRAQFLRNAVGAHFNVNADAISEQEVDDVTADVRWLWATLSCGSCHATSTRGDTNNGKWEIKFPCDHS